MPLPLIILALVMLGGCKADAPDDTEHRRLVVLERLPQLEKVADDIEARLPGPDVAFSSTVAAALAPFELAQLSRTKAPEHNGVVKTEPVTATFPGGEDEVARFVARLTKVRRPWVFEALRREEGVVAIDVVGYSFDPGTLQRSSTETPRVKEALTKLAAKGYDPARVQRLERVSMKQAILADLDRRAAHAQGDLRLLVDSASASVLPKALTLTRTSGKKRGTIVFESKARRARFVGEASRRGALHDAAANELILPSGTVCRISGG
ncbi:MAG: hypothetical protein RMA76_36085 [Deltaproteobacteria bacterium]|jgi:hypothetical protein